MNTHNVRICAAHFALLAVASAALVSGTSAQESTQAANSVQTIEALKAGALASGGTLTPQALGDFSRDTVYTAIAPCRLVDTRIAGGKIPDDTTRTFDVDGTALSSQGGAASGCGIPFGVVSAVAMTITATHSTVPGFLSAWGLGTQPAASVLNYGANQAVANTTIVPVVPGTGADFSIYANKAADVIVDVVGYFAAPVASSLDCTSVVGPVTAIPPNAYTAADAICPVGRTVTGGGSFPIEGTLGRPNIWMDGSPTANGWRNWVDNQTGSTRSVQSYAVCCRMPGR